jgi:hypothetical protein
MPDPIRRPDNQESDETDQYQVKHSGNARKKVVSAMHPK